MANHAPKVDAGAKLLFVLSSVALLGVVYILVSSLINTYTRNSTKGEITASSNVEKASNNLKPVGTSSTSDAPVAAATSTAARSGKEVYAAVCQACHATGVAGSPKFGDKAAWEPRAATGLDALLNSAMNGKGAMPARGGNPSVTDAELKATILYMTKEAGFNLGGAAAPATAPKAQKQPTASAPKAEPAAEPKMTEKTKQVATPKAPEVQPKPAQPATPATPNEPKAPVVAAVAATANNSAPAKNSAPANNSASLEAGKKVYDTVCFACHKTGVAGAPVFGNKEAWAPRLATGPDALYSSVLNGKGAMPPKGGNTSLSDDDVKAAVDYIANNSH